MTDIFFVIMTLIFPVLVSLILIKNFKELGDEEFEVKYGSLKEGTRTNSKWAVIYTVIFILRRLHFAAIALFLTEDYEWLQVLMFTF